MSKSWQAIIGFWLGKFPENNDNSKRARYRDDDDHEGRCPPLGWMGGTGRVLTPSSSRDNNQPIMKDGCSDNFERSINLEITGNATKRGSTNRHWPFREWAQGKGPP
ncbi:hypothetical protein SNK03_003663 [Fusarium graminearum]|uniref:Chromosome 1, complete genome n=1 Tax=Gibberella zeae (strain ATCC MYA-4620 / CBS 123657 / FGSC 9075 / NRRL 31084 / PH-1) TaxID=229533 RepID=I1SA53_GIBZE|nr:hypothetical protein FGSG_13734 [Fusarium graminearum PH-1]ESU16980.1 hypothetical protein FGSG_13734 [Fusarium graminearum PH-1]CEF75668.1 unnamed protein product [Fusarium graminearum]CZS78949.1 unnamed protein product [Fusarium graminearum]|eukprot:XP_011319242.1 hypothetical protein FGSG_13734 [Fusarium graminearum PH-1]